MAQASEEEVWAIWQYQGGNRRDEMVGTLDTQGEAEQLVKDTVARGWRARYQWDKKVEDDGTIHFRAPCRRFTIRKFWR